MMYHTCFVALVSIVLAANHLAYGQRPMSENCAGQNTCNDLEEARRCGDYEFCKKQAIACGAKHFLEQGATSIWKNILTDVNTICNNNYTPFKKLYGSPDLTGISLQVSPGREPSTLSFNFKGDANAPSRHGVSITLNNKQIYDDIISLT